jgi:1,4-alpha-glucan branching enzyme
MVPQPLEEYKIPVYELGTYKIVLNTDDMAFGGSGYPTGVSLDGTFEAIEEEFQGKPYHVKFNLPPLAGVYFMKVKDPAPKKSEKKAEKKAPAVKKPAAKKPAAKKPAAKKTTAKTASKKNTNKSEVGKNG